MDIKQSFKDQPTIAFFTSLIENNFPSFSCIYQRNSIKPTYIKPNVLQVLH